jgi:putative ABC transport system permease protein
LVKKDTDPRVAGKALKQVWDKFQIKRPYEFHNVTYGLNNQYAEEDRLVRLINTLSILAIFIAFLGLFGLASFTVAQRTKEIGIRKVLGASLGQVLSLIARDFMRLVIVACIVALPIAYTLMQEWLQNFAYRIVLIQHWYIFLIGLLLAMLVALAAVSFHAIRAARLNPVDILKDE